MNVNVNTMMVHRIVAKDWFFNRVPIAIMVALGAVALALAGAGGEAGFFAGGILLITVVISIGIQLVMTTVIYERSERTLAFAMTLPISPREFTAAKLIGNLTIFAAAWGALAVGTVAVIASRETLPDGLIPFALAVLGQLFAGYCLLLAVAVVSESMAWTIVAIVAGNLLVQGVMYWLSHVPAIARALPTDAIAWPGEIVGLLAIEAVAIVAMIALTFHLQTKKSDFL